MEALVARRPYLLPNERPWGLRIDMYAKLLNYAIATNQTRALQKLVPWSFSEIFFRPVIQKSFLVLARSPGITKNMIDAFRPYQELLQDVCDASSGNTVFHYFASAPPSTKTHFHIRHLIHVWGCTNAGSRNHAGVTAGELFANSGQIRCARLCGYVLSTIEAKAYSTRTRLAQEN